MSSSPATLRLPIPVDQLVRLFGEQPAVRALAVMGSQARGDAGMFSDIDLVRFTADSAPELSDDGTHVVENQLVVASTVTEQQLREWFEQPQLAVMFIAGLRSARALLDRDGFLAGWQERARRFVWDGAMKRRADRWVSTQLVGWAEEVHKGLEGLRRGGDVGRLLNARHGCSFGLAQVVQVHLGLLVDGDNGFYDALESTLGSESSWVRLRATAFGVQDDTGRGPTLPEQVWAGLQLYVETVRLVDSVIQPEHRAVIEHTVEQIGVATPTSEPPLWGS